MINYYEYETSPRKEEPEFIPRQKRRTDNTIRNKEELKRKARKIELMQSRRNVKHIIEIGLVFIVLLTISYRYALINSRFSEKESLKATLLALQKQNAQLRVNIEQGMNINNIEQAAKEKLGMQKLDNNQKVYINLETKDFVESTPKGTTNEVSESWWQKFLKTLRGE